MIDLKKLTDGGRVRNLTGHERGLAARSDFELDKLDREESIVEVYIPEEVDAITVSFFQGMFAASVKAAGDNFLQKYHFHASQNVMEQILRGIKRVQTVRGSVLG